MSVVWTKVRLRCMANTFFFFCSNVPQLPAGGYATRRILPKRWRHKFRADWTPNIFARMAVDRGEVTTSEGPGRLLGRLGVRREREGQSELKSCTSPGGTGGPQVPAMRLNDRPTDGQAHTSPLILGRKECFEDLFRLLRWQSHAGIADRDQHLTVVSFRLDGKLTLFSRALHGVDTVEHEVHENLLQLDSVCHDLGKILGKLDTDGDCVAVRIAAQQDNHFLNDVFY